MKGPAISEYIKRVIQLFVIHLSGVHCIIHFYCLLLKSQINYSARCLMGSRIIRSSAYCNQILLAQLYINGAQNSSVNWIIQLLLSLSCWPKVILLSGGHCITFHLYTIQRYTIWLEICLFGTLLSIPPVREMKVFIRISVRETIVTKQMGPVIRGYAIRNFDFGTRKQGKTPRITKKKPQF